MVRFLSDDLQAFKFTDRVNEYLLTNVWFKTNKQKMFTEVNCSFYRITTPF